RRQYTDDLSWHAVHAKYLTENVRIGITTESPVGVGQNNHSAVFNRRDRFRLGKGATHRQVDAKCREKIRRDAHQFFLLGGTGVANDFAAVTKDGKAREGRDVSA